MDKLSYTQKIRQLGKPDITAKYARSIIDYKPDFGIMTARINRGGLRIGQQVGTINLQGYRQVFIDYWSFKASRLAFLMMEGHWPPAGMMMDHIDGDKANDKWSNLRLATPQQNARNRRPCKRNKSGKVGVCIGTDPDKWEANITVDNKTLKLGCFEVKADAVAARCVAEKHYFGEFARRASNG
ncbi:MAG: HNH endonuclease [Hyphomicrobiales bacterium]|nr:HNH endonuclease [Hyphomicrobiales bacterium]